MSRRARTAAAVVVTALLSGGCATRDLSSGPTTQPGAGTWLAVGTASLLAAVVLGVLLVRPVPRTAAGGHRFGAAVLGLHAGAVVVGTAVLVGLAIRSGQLADRPEDAEMAVSIVRVGSIDGDASLFAMIVLALLAIGGLVALLLVLAGRFLLGVDPVERWIAVGVLALELGVFAYATVRVAVGDRAVGWVIVALQLPLVAAAMVSAWPRPDPRQTAPPPLPAA